MGAWEIVDLLSSDTEAQLPPAKTREAKGSLRNCATNPAVVLPNSFDEEWIQGPSKRRKLSPSSPNEVNAYTLPTLPRADHRSSSYELAFQAKSPKGAAWAAHIASDDITFTSSLEHSVSRTKTTTAERSRARNNSSDDSLPEDVLLAPLRSKLSGLSARTAALLDNISEPSARSKPTKPRKQLVDVSKKKSKERSPELLHDGDSSATEDQKAAPTKASKASRKPKLTEEEKVARAKEKEREKVMRDREKESAKLANKELKAKEKEEDQERKRLLKEEKARDKRIAADLAEVNKLKLDKKDSTPEMIIDLPASIDGQSVNTQIKEFMKNLDVDATLYQSSIPNIIKWRRKMKARWNAQLDYWEPIEPMEIHEEKHVMCLMSAKEFIALTTVQNNDQDIETHVAKLKSAHECCIPIYLIEGLHGSMQKSKTAENRAYQERVNSLNRAEDLTSTSQQGPRRKKPVTEIIDEDLIEDTLLRLQVLHNCLIHHTSTPKETAEWVANFTQHISTIPYRSVPFMPQTLLTTTYVFLDTNASTSPQPSAWNPAKLKPATTKTMPSSKCCRK